MVWASRIQSGLDFGGRHSANVVGLKDWIVVRTSTASEMRSEVGGSIGRRAAARARRWLILTVAVKSGMGKG